MNQTINKFLCICLLLCSVSYITQAQTTDAPLEPHSGSSHYKCDHANYKAAVEAKMGKTQPEGSLNKMAGCRKVRVFYIIPSDAPRSDREQICEVAMREIQQQWASQGRTAYVEPIITINSNQPQSWFLGGNNPGWRFMERAKEVIGNSYGNNFGAYRTVFFLEMENAVAAYGGDSDGYAGLPEWIIHGVEQQLETDFRAEIGAVGHELGHAFSMGHEDGNDGSVNCDNQCVPKGIMCNGYSPSPCGPETSYPYVALNNYNNGKLNWYPDYFTEIGSSCDGPKFISQYGDVRPITGVQYKYVIKAKHSDKALTLAADGNVVQAIYTGADNQQWYFTAPQYNMTRPDSYGYYQIKNAANNNNLEVPYGRMNNGDNVGAYSAQDVNHQKWKVIDRSGGHFAFQNLKSGRVLDVRDARQAENANIHQWNWAEVDNQQWSLEPASCFDGIQNGNETDVDCGGSDCSACPTCVDNIFNGNETGIDCGGSDCSPCPPENCSMYAFDGTIHSYDINQDFGTATVQDDGATLFVEGNSWKAVDINYTFTPQTVIEFDFKSTQEGEIHEISFDSNLSFESFNRIQMYGTQSDFPDYTVTLYDGSGDWQHYVIPLELSSSVTYQYMVLTADDDANAIGNSYFRNIQIYEDLNGNGVCNVAITCNDGIQNGDETGIDCGGTNCTACFTCNDGIQNGNETSVDCGGTDCVACPTCSDGIQNQDETGIDCGGSCASVCPDCFVILSNTGCNTVQIVYYADLNATPVTMGTLAADSSQTYPADTGSFWAYVLDNQIITYWNTDCNNTNFAY